MRSMILVLGVVVLGGGRAGAAEPCELNPAKGCYDKGIEAFKSKDAAAVGWFEKACASKVAEGCTELGFLLMEGFFVPRDDARSRAVSLQACELGSGLGCNNAFVMVRDGRGGPRDDGELRRLADRSCALEDGEGCFLSAAVREEPIGGARDDTAAKKALESSCKLGFWMGCSVIAHRLLEGSQGYDEDEVRGVKMMARACELGGGEPCHQVAGWMAEGARGLDVDREQALVLFARACELEHGEACARERELRLAMAKGELMAKLVRRSSKRVLLELKEGDAPPVGALGEVSKKERLGGLEMMLAIAKVTVTRVEGRTIEVTVTEDLARIEIDGKKVDHWNAGIALKLAWERPDKP